MGKVGDMIAPSLLSTRPLLLLMMNANDMHLAFTATSTHIVPYFFVAGLRRCMEDPIFFFLGANCERAVDGIAEACSVNLMTYSGEFPSRTLCQGSRSSSEVMVVLI